MANRTKAFTLIELLVVIAIIAILAAILFPVFAQAKQSAKKAAAISNTKQMVLASLMYIDDNDGRLLPRYDADGTQPTLPDTSNMWENVIYAYVKNQMVYEDPAAIDIKYGGIAADNPPAAPTLLGRGWDSIGENATMRGWYWIWPSGQIDLNVPRDTGFPNSSIVVMFGSSSNGPTAQGWRGYLFRNDALNAPGLSFSNRHNGGTVLGMLDGHAKWFNFKAIFTDPNGYPNYVCPPDTTYQSGAAYLDLNSAHLKMNLQDGCIQDPSNP